MTRTLQAAVNFARSEAENEALRDREQNDVDALCYYRNLAIRLGADPADMRNAHDRHLAETKLCDDDGRQSLDAERREIGESWQQVERADARIAALEAENDTLRARLSLVSVPEFVRESGAVG